jgi:single-strand DNA-binding protein
LLGNLGKDAELTYTPSGQALSKFSLATNRRWQDKNGEWQDETEWHNIVLWGKTAESVSQYLTKGQKVYVEGRIKSRTWEGKDGNKHYATDIIAERIVLAGSRGAGDEGAPTRPRTTAARPAAQSAGPAQSGPDEGLQPEITDDDIPF